MKQVKQLSVILFIVLLTQSWFPAPAQTNDERQEYFIVNNNNKVSSTITYSAEASKLEPEYCTGYYAGYAIGYCYKIPGCAYSPSIVCPIPGIDQTTYSDGYKEGFLNGYNANH